MVANLVLLIGITFLTLYDDINGPIVALESTASNTPPWNTKANVVVP